MKRRFTIGILVAAAMTFNNLILRYIHWNICSARSDGSTKPGGDFNRDQLNFKFLSFQENTAYTSTKKKKKGLRLKFHRIRDHN